MPSAARPAAHPVEWAAVETRGYARVSRHWLASLADGRTAFVKQALTPDASAWLRKERTLYEAVDGSFMPAYLGAYDDGKTTLLVLEDLSGADWPPPWSADPEPLLATGLCSPAWLEHALPTLLHAGEAAELGGDELLHFDVRSDNLCLIDRRAILVDWNLACEGNGAFDVAFWLPSLRLEGGPEPSEILPDAGALAAAVAGFFAARAGLAPPPGAPTVRVFQRAQAAVALPWAAAELGLPPPSQAGPAAR
jgi:hypothetical protein